MIFSYIVRTNACTNTLKYIDLCLIYLVQLKFHFCIHVGLWYVLYIYIYEFEFY